MATGQSVNSAPQTLPPDFGQWDSSSNTLPPDFNHWDTPQQSKPFSAVSAGGHFLKTLGTAVASPQFMGNGGQLDIPPDVQSQVETNLRQKGLLQTIRDYSNDPNKPSAFQTLWNNIKTLNPIRTDEFASDPSAAVGDSAANLLMLRQMLRGAGGKLPEFGAPNAYAEQVGSLGNYTKVQPQQPPNPYAPKPYAVGPGVIDPEYIGEPDPRTLAGNQGVITTGQKLLPAQADAAQTLRQRLRDLSRASDYTLSQAFNIQKVREGMEQQRGVTLEAQQEADARMQQYAKSPWEKGDYIKVPEKVGTQAGAENDTALFQKAKSQLGPNASLSDVAQLAQKMKASQVPKIGPFPAMDTSEPQVVNNTSDLADLLMRSLQRVQAAKANGQK